MNADARSINIVPCLHEPSEATVPGAVGATCALCFTAEPQTADVSANGEKSAATQNELRCLSKQMMDIQESERKRIATDLHDGLGQSLTLIKMGLEECSALLQENELAEVNATLQQLRIQVQNSFNELRRVAMGLRPSMLDDLGILATLSWFFREFESACHGITIEKHLPLQESTIPGPLKVAIFRILQEAVCNIVKHANADHIRVSLVSEGKALQLSIDDNGQGFDPAAASHFCPHTRGRGLVSMQERAIISGGTYRIESAISQGTHITVSWPCA